MKIKAYIKPTLLLLVAIGLLAICVVKSHAAHSSLNNVHTTIVSDTTNSNL